jgi:hypothetical protein
LLLVQLAAQQGELVAALLLNRFEARFLFPERGFPKFVGMGVAGSQFVVFGLQPLFQLLPGCQRLLPVSLKFPAGLFGLTLLFQQE